MSLWGQGNAINVFRGKILSKVKCEERKAKRLEVKNKIISQFDKLWLASESQSVISNISNDKI